MVNIIILDTFNIIVSALLYGACFSFILGLVSFLYDVINALIFGIKRGEQNLESNKDKRMSKASNTQKPLIITTFGILIFGVGFLIFLYATLDGNLRLYPLLLSFISFWLIDNFVISKFQFWISGYIYRVCFRLKKLFKKTVGKVKK